MNNSFTFWSNMKEAIDAYDGMPEYQFKLYDALTEYALYETWPEDDGSIESKGIIAFVQSMVPSIEKSAGYIQKCAVAGEKGGRTEKVSNEQLENAIKRSAVKIGGMPTRDQIAQTVKEMYGISINSRTVSRRYPESQKNMIASQALRDINNVPIGTKETNGTKVMSQGQNRDISNVPVPYPDLGF